MLRVCGIKDIHDTKRLASLWAPNMALHVTHLHPQTEHFFQKSVISTPDLRQKLRIPQSNAIQ